MKKLLLLVLLTLSTLSRAQLIVDNTYMSQALAAKIDVVNTVADLKAKAITNPDLVVLVQGKSTVMDGQGAFYRWMVGSTDAEDMTFLNVVTSTVSSAGRWVRLNVRNQQLTHGILAMSSGIKTFYWSGVTNSSSEFVVNLTYDGTPTGTAFCNTILKNSATAYLTINSTNDAVVTTVKLETAKSVTYVCTKNNNAVLGVVGTLFNSFIAAPVNTKVRAEITCL